MNKIIFCNLLFVLIIILFQHPCKAQFGNQTAIASIDFAQKTHAWDGFGVNYVESCQTLDYEKKPQDLGGFSILYEQQKQDIIDLFFGADGLRPEVIKMFLDPWHQTERNGAYNHEWSTQQMRYFVENSLKSAREIGDSLSIITTLYGPPAFMTKHNSPTISILNPEFKKDMALYMIDWIKYLKEQNYPVHYLSLHNEGTDWLRWPHYENHPNAIQNARDYNLLWSAQDIADYLAFLKPIMTQEGLANIGLTPGEPINLFRFNQFGIADAIIENKDALNSIGLITSHGFGLGRPFGRGYANSNNYGATLLKQHKPNLKTWITSMSWGKMDPVFGAEMCEHINGNLVSSITPWAAIQRGSHWYANNHHPGCAVEVMEDSTYEIRKGYYYFKQFSRAGRAQMQVVRATINRPDVYITAFSQHDSKNPDAFVIVNLGESLKYTSDLIELNFDVNNNPLYYCFPYKDLIQAYEQDKPRQMTDVQFAAQETTDGYVMEFAFPWKTLGGQAEDVTDFKFDVQARDGRDMPHGRIGWLGENNEFSGKLILGDKSGRDGHDVTIARTDNPIIIDGHPDKLWKNVSNLPMNNNLMPGTPPFISGQWQMQYDDDNVYVLVTMQDPSNEMHRILDISIKHSQYKKFKAFRTTELGENYENIGEYRVENDILHYPSPNQSVTTFIGIE